MEKKKLNIILILCIIIVLLIGIIAFLLFKDTSKNFNNKEENAINEEDTIVSEEENNNINQELKNTISFATKKYDNSAKLVAIQRDGTEVNILDLTKYFFKSPSLHGESKYVYDNGTLYVSLFTYDGDNHSHQLASIDLNKGNGNYELKILKNLDEEKIERSSNIYADYISKIGDNIYLSQKNVYKYNLKTGEISNTNINTKENRTVWIYSYKNNLIYQNGMDIYTYDETTNNSTLLIKNADIEFIYNNKLIYNAKEKSTDENNSISYAFNSYDFKTKEIKKIGVGTGKGSIYDNYIVPYQNKYIYLDSKELMNDSSTGKTLTCENMNFNSYNFDCNKYTIWSITRSGDNKITINYEDANQVNGTLQGFVIEYDLNNNKIISKEDNIYHYYSVLYIN